MELVQMRENSKKVKRNEAWGGGGAESEVLLRKEATDGVLSGDMK